MALKAPCVHHARSGRKVLLFAWDKSKAELCQLNAFPALLPVAARDIKDPLKPLTWWVIRNSTSTSKIPMTNYYFCGRNILSLE